MSHRPAPTVQGSHRGDKALPRIAYPLFCVSILLACSDGSGPDPFPISGHYDLVEVNATPLPGVIQIDGWTGDSLMVTGGEISVLSRGRLSIVHESEWRTGAAGVLPNFPDTSIVTYRHEDDRLLVDHPGAIPAPYTDTIAIQTSVLRFTGVVKGTRNVLIYQQR